MNNTFDKLSYSEQLQELHNQYELAKKSTRKAEQKLNAAKNNESKALADMTDFIKKSFVQQLKDFFDGAPVAIQVFNHSKDYVLPPEDEPDRYGVRILPTVLQEDDVYVNGEYASVNPIEMDFIDIYHGEQPWIQPYDAYYPSFTNIIFLPKDSKWIKSRYIPVKNFSVIKELMERNHKLYTERLDEEISKLKEICPNYKAYSASSESFDYLLLVGNDSVCVQYTNDSFPHVRKGDCEDPLWYSTINRKYERKEISTNDAFKILDGIVRGNRKYYKETVAKAKKWFDDCVKLAEEHKTENGDNHEKTNPVQ
jgi:hypothetical protein